MATIESNVGTGLALAFTLKRQNLTVKVIKSGTSATIELEGELDAASATILDGSIREEEKSGLTSLTLEMNRLSFIDSSGLGTIVSAARRASIGGWVFRVLGAQGAVRRTLDIAGVDAIFRYLNRAHET